MHTPIGVNLPRKTNNHSPSKVKPFCITERILRKFPDANNQTILHLRICATFVIPSAPSSPQPAARPGGRREGWVPQPRVP